MLGAPRAASAWPSDSVSAGRRGWGKGQRLLRASEYAALAGPDVSWRAARRWVAMSARIEADADPGPSPARAGASAAPLPVPPAIPLTLDRVRFGLTVPKRQAKRAVARNLVKRILRESARQAAPALCLAAGPMRADVLLRLKAPLPAAGAATWSELCGQLRREADSLMEQLQERLRRNTLHGHTHGAGTAQAREGGVAGAPRDAAPMLAQSSEGAPAPGDKSAGARS